MPMIHKLYGYHYEIHPIYCRCADVGHTANTRNRVYVILVHKTNAHLVHDVQELYDAATDTIRSYVWTEISDYLVAEQWEIDMEVADLARTRSKQSVANAPLIA